MTYIDITYYSGLYGVIPAEAFNRIAWDASRKLDEHTTGADNIRKLQVAFPTDGIAAESVRRCCAKLVNTMHQIEQATAAATMAKGYVETDNGLRGRVISSVSAGNESISYATGNVGTATEIDKAVADPKAREQLYYRIIREHLSGVADANGVGLLYLGPYCWG